nr:antithrombin-III-like [Penaeus vannamei]
MVLTNAVYFKGFWKYPFKPQRTHKDKFFVTPEESVQVDMMSQTRSGLEGVSRPGAGDALQGRQRVHGGAPPAMWKGSKTVDWLVQRLKPKVLVSELKAMPSVSLRVKFPKFSVESTLGDELISALIEVDEEGAEAAAATAFVLNRSRSMPPKTTFTCNRPFVFFIQDNEANNILFMGVYRGP